MTGKLWNNEGCLSTQGVPDKKNLLFYWRVLNDISDLVWFLVLIYITRVNIWMSQQYPLT